MKSADLFYLRLGTIEDELDYIQKNKSERVLFFNKHKYLGYAKIGSDYPFGNSKKNTYVLLDRLSRFEEYDIIKVVVKYNLYHPQQKFLFAKLTTTGEELLDLIRALDESFKTRQLRTLADYLLKVTEYNTEEWKRKNKLSPFVIRKKYGLIFYLLLKSGLCVPKNNIQDVYYAQYELTEQGKEWVILIKKLLNNSERTHEMIDKLLESTLLLKNDQ